MLIIEPARALTKFNSIDFGLNVHIRLGLKLVQFLVNRRYICICVDLKSLSFTSSESSFESSFCFVFKSYKGLPV